MLMAILMTVSPNNGQSLRACALLLCLKIPFGNTPINYFLIPGASVNDSHL